MYAHYIERIEAASYTLCFTEGADQGDQGNMFQDNWMDSVSGIKIITFHLLPVGLLNVMIHVYMVMVTFWISYVNSNYHVNMQSFTHRRDKYEKHLKLYWVEKNLCGRMLTLECNDSSAHSCWCSLRYH